MAAAALFAPLAAAAQEGAAAAAPPPPGEPLILHATPMLAEKLPKGGPKPSAFLYGERISSQMLLQSVAEGHAELRRPGLTARGDRITHDQSSDIATFEGDVRFNWHGDRYTATEGQLQVDAFAGAFLNPTYRFLSNNAYGNADRVVFIDPDRLVLVNGNYTTCQRQDGDWQPDWILEADRMDLDREENLGRAEGAVLRFKGVPILPLPGMSFPLSEERQSGWLPPTIGLDNKSGLTLAVPYYWNIAPNRDATFTPQVMLRRGVNAEGEFRYLEDGYRGRAQVSLLPDDRLRDRNRWSLFWQHGGKLETGLQPVGPLNLAINLNRVSDNNYWSDFPHSGLSQLNRLLGNSAAVSWSRGDFTLAASALKWQTLQDVTAPIVPPYDRMPELTGRWARANDGGFDYSISADYTRFHGDPALTLQPNANREVLQAQIARPFTRPWGFFTPKAQVHASAYQFDRALAATGASTASRAVPTVSLDGGLVFERDARYLGRAFRQTLEPRLMYVYTPYRDQNGLPNYDSGVYDFNFATIWNENSFVGDDRVVDNNLVTGGLTTRLLDPETGAEAVRLDIAQRYRFSGQRVVLPGGSPTSPGWSDLMLGASLNWDPRWNFDTVVQYNPDTHKSTRTTVAVRYSPGPYRTAAVAYRHERDLKSESVDLGWQWPLGDLWGGRKELDHGKSAASRGGGGGSCGNGAWYSMGRLNYSLSDRQVVDAVMGVEYNAGCWIGRAAFEELRSTTSTATRRILFQLEFVGFSRLGSSLMSTLRNNIPRYQSINQDLPPPSRFTAYD